VAGHFCGGRQRKVSLQRGRIFYYLIQAVSPDRFPYIVYPVRHKSIHKVIVALKHFEKNPFFDKGIKRGFYG
jgi:hypothetical protein